MASEKGAGYLSPKTLLPKIRDQGWTVLHAVDRARGANCEFSRTGI